MLETLRKQDFDAVYRLMEKSFPRDEYRSYAAQKKLLDHPRYTVYTVSGEEHAITAFLAVWEFETFAFIEHFAVDPACRNGGIGSKMLDALRKLLRKPLCLEVELPETELSERRIRFYQRNHFYLNTYQYMQPPLSEEGRALPLYLMTSDAAIDEREFAYFKETLYTEVYRVGMSEETGNASLSDGDNAAKN